MTNAQYKKAKKIKEDRLKILKSLNKLKRIKNDLASIDNAEYWINELINLYYFKMEVLDKEFDSI